jgi:hypothetical protein
VRSVWTRPTPSLSGRRMRVLKGGFFEAQLAVTLCHAGVLSRDELAAAFDEGARRQHETGASENHKIAVECFHEFFKMAVRGASALSTGAVRPLAATSADGDSDLGRGGPFGRAVGGSLPGARQRERERGLPFELAALLFDGPLRERIDARRDQARPAFEPSASSEN